MNRLPAGFAAAIVLISAGATPTHVQAQVSAYASMRAPRHLPPATSPTPFGFSVFPTDGWTSHTAMPSVRWAHALASYSMGAYPSNDAFVYVISGGDGSFANTSSVLRYDVTFDTWAPMASLPAARLQLSAVQVGGRIFVPGGYASGFSPVSGLDIYDIATDTWTAGAPLLQATGDYAIGTYDNRYVYVVGGYSGSGDLNTVQVYDTQLNTWQLATPKSGTATAGLRGGIVGNHMIVVGGYSQVVGGELSDVQIGTIDAVDPTIIAWTAGASYPGGNAGRLGAGVPMAAGPAQGLPALDFVVFTAGDPDGSGSQVKNDTWVYDFRDDSWKSGPPKLTGVSNIGDIVGISSGGKLHMVSTGGYDGSAVVSVQEWLTLGYEEPADLALTMSDGDVSVAPNGSVAYSLAYTVTGSAGAPNATITETVPAGTTFQAATSTAGWVCAPDANAGSTCEFPLGALADGANGSVVFSVDVTYPVAPGVTEILNNASIATTALYAPEQNLVNNVASDTTPFADGAVDITPVSGLVTGEDGKSANFQVVLAVPPIDDVTIAFVSDDLSEGVAAPAQLLFTTANWNVPQSVTVTGLSDFLADGDVAYTVSGSIQSGTGNYANVAVPTVSLINLDGPSDRIFADGFDGVVPARR
ncbi:MAG: kelch repeat-containing protein [Dokdonella sp.]